jgi:hypothetical protein
MEFLTASSFLDRSDRRGASCFHTGDTTFLKRARTPASTSHGYGTRFRNRRMYRSLPGIVHGSSNRSLAEEDEKRSRAFRVATRVEQRLGFARSLGRNRLCKCIATGAEEDRAVGGALVGHGCLAHGDT